MSTNEIIRRRALRSSGAAIDWESIARGMCDYKTPFIIMEATTPPTAGANLFQSCPALTSIYVPDASVEAYKAATNWSTYASKIKGISERPVGGVILNQFYSGCAAERTAA